MSLETIYKILDVGIDNLPEVLSKILFQRYKYDIEKILYCLKTIYNIELEYDATSGEELSYDSIKRKDYIFKQKVHEKYKKCIVCENDCHPVSYQVAHIIDFAICNKIGSNFESAKYDPNNGLLLCANMHLYFDSKMLNFITTQGDLNVQIEFNYSMNEYDFYRKYNGKKIMLDIETIYNIIKRTELS